MSRIKEGLIVAGAFTLGIAGIGGAACGDSEETLQTPTPIVTNLETPPPSIMPTTEVTSTPQETIVHELPYTSIPSVPSKFRDSAEAIMGFWKAKRLEGNRFKLVVNESYEMDVIGLGDISEDEVGPGSTTAFVKARSVDEAFGIRRQVCADILEAGGAKAAGIIIRFNIIVPNAGKDPFSEIYFTDQQKEEFLTPTTCEVTS